MTETNPPKDNERKIFVRVDTSGGWVDSDQCRSQDAVQIFQEEAKEERKSRFRLISTHLWPKQKCCRMLDSWPYQLITMVLVLISLFCYNISVLLEAGKNVELWLDGLLIFCMVAFYADIILNAICRPRPAWWLLFLDFLATSTIVVDLSWVVNAAEFHENSGSHFSDSAVLSAQAGRILRLVRLLRLLRVVSILTVIARHRLQKRKESDPLYTTEGNFPKPPAPSNIGAKLTDLLVLQVSLVVIIVVLCTAILTSWGALSSPLDASISFFQSLAENSYTRTELQPHVDSFIEFVKSKMSRYRLLTLNVRGETWSWLPDEGGYPSRSSAIIVFTSERLGGNSSESPIVSMEIDASEQHSKDALVDMITIVMVLFVLLAFVALVNITVYRTLLRPLDRIFYTIHTNAAQVVAALGRGDFYTESPGTGDEDPDIYTIEAVIVKMSRLLVHVTEQGPQGSHILKTMVKNADGPTRNWLATMLGENVHRHDELCDQGRTSCSRSVDNSEHDVSLSGSNLQNAVQNGEKNAVVASKEVHQSATGSDSRARQLSLVSKRSSNRRCSINDSDKLNTKRAPPQDEVGWEATESITSSSSVVGELGPLSRLVTSSFAGINAGLQGVSYLGVGLTKEQKEAFCAVDLRQLYSFNFDALSLSRDALVPHIVTMFLQLELARFGPSDNHESPGDTRDASFVDAHILWNFVQEVSTYYQDVPYHNFYHCTDVAHATFLLLDRLRGPAKLTALECFALMIAAVAHDMDHPGVNNAYLVNSRDTLALTYNDASVLENRHVACLYALVNSNTDLDIFRELQPAEWKEVRRIIIETILHTDMAKHFAMTSKLDVFLELHGAELAAAHSAQSLALKTNICEEELQNLTVSTALYYGANDGPTFFSTPEERTILLCTILHCADISNPARPTEIAEKWTDRVLTEFFLQGDKERAAGQSISPLCDREETSKILSQINFIEYVVAPIFDLLCRIYPETGELIMNTTKTRQYWHAQAMRELSFGAQNTEEIAQMEERMTKYLQRYKKTLTLVSKRQKATCQKLNFIASFMMHHSLEDGSSEIKTSIVQDRKFVSEACSPRGNDRMRSTSKDNTRGDEVGMIISDAV